MTKGQTMIGIVATVATITIGGVSFLYTTLNPRIEAEERKSYEQNGEINTLKANMNGINEKLSTQDKKLDALLRVNNINPSRFTSSTTQ